MDPVRPGKEEFLVRESYMGNGGKAYIPTRNFYEMVISFYAHPSETEKNAIRLPSLTFFIFPAYCVLLPFYPSLLPNWA